MPIAGPTDGFTDLEQTPLADSFQYEAIMLPSLDVADYVAGRVAAFP